MSEYKELPSDDSRKKPAPITICPEVHKRVKEASKGIEGADIKSLTNALLDYALLQYESGKIAVEPLQFVETRKEQA